MPEPRFEKVPLPPDVMRLLDAASGYTETDLRLERLAQFDDKVHALLRHLENLAEIAERRWR